MDQKHPTLLTRACYGLLALLLLSGLACGLRDRGGNAISSPLSADAVFAQASPAVVQVVTQDRQGRNIGSGSGFLVSNNGLIATSFHVIENASTTDVVLADKTMRPVVEIVALDQEADIAIIKAAGPITAKPLELAGSDLPAVGTKVYAIGNPEGLTHSLSDGLVAAHREIGRSTEIQTTAPISPGSSGGPMLGADGRVIGVTRGLFKEGQNLNFAVPVCHVARLLLRCESERQLTRSPLPRQPAPEPEMAKPASPSRPKGADPVEWIKKNLALGMSEKQVGQVFEDAMVYATPDKGEIYLKDELIPDFNYVERTTRGAHVTRHFPSGSQYRLNLLFVDSHLQDWYGR
jgi:S1-C subfamily serine protease